MKQQKRFAPRFCDNLRAIFVLRFFCLPFFCLTSFVQAEATSRIDPNGIGGKLVIVGGGSIPEKAKQKFIEAVGDDGVIVVIAAASANPLESGRSALRWLTEAGAKNVVLPESTDDRDADRAALAAVIAKAKGVWIGGGQQLRLAKAYQGTDVEAALRKLLDDGGVIGGTSAGAAIMSRVMIASGRDTPELVTGLDLLPDGIVDQHFTQRNRVARSRRAVLDNPLSFGLGIDEATAVIVSGRSMEIVGSGTVTLLKANTDCQVTTEQLLHPGEKLDLTQLRRAVQTATLGLGPDSKDFGKPRVESGSLVIVGGGGMPESIVNKFVELAGGDKARIVMLPTAGSRDDAFRAKVPGFLANAVVADVKMLPHSRPEEIASEEFQQALKGATGIWFGGGRQWNFLDAYDGTNAIELFHDCLRRGGVIGGSSAGATIQGEYLVRGHTQGNSVMMALGYERGFSFLPGTTIDQHFTQRGRKPDLIPVIRRYPQLLGIGIDESTALVVQGSSAEVIGSHAVHFLTGAQLDDAATSPSELTTEAAASQYLTVSSGGQIDLASFCIAEQQ